MARSWRSHSPARLLRSLKTLSQQRKFVMKCTTLILLVCTTVASIAQPNEKLPGPLLDGLGTLHHPITTQSKQAQLYFVQGMRLLFGFNHREAIRSFRSAAHFDPDCAMAYWGI